MIKLSSREKTIVIFALILLVANLYMYKAVTYIEVFNNKRILFFGNIVSTFNSIKQAPAAKKLKNERVKLVAAYGGQEKVDELFKADKLFCLDDTDCAFQKTWCCGKAVNRYNVTKYIPEPYASECWAVCTHEIPKCQNNKCKLDDGFGRVR